MDPGALCWCLRSLGVSIFGLLFMSITLPCCHKIVRSRVKNPPTVSLVRRFSSTLVTVLLPASFQSLLTVAFLLRLC